jgi:hypothetical protein
MHGPTVVRILEYLQGSSLCLIDAISRHFLRVILENHELSKDSRYPGWNANRDLNAECRYSALILHKTPYHLEEWRCTAFLSLPSTVVRLISCIHRSFYVRRQTPAWTPWQNTHRLSDSGFSVVMMNELPLQIRTRREELIKSAVFEMTVLLFGPRWCWRSRFV